MAHQMPLETQQQLRRLAGNNRCVDCDAPYPQWATVSYGTFMCLECSGRHRGLGVHISFVRSVTMDSWTDKQIQQMQQGGNDRFRQEFAAAGVPTTLSIQQKYNTPQAEAYRKGLLALVEGKPAVPLPRWDPSCIKANGNSSMTSSSSFGSSSSFSSNGSGSGFGSDTKGVEALKGETEQEYVARQMRLREEARARMQAKFGSSGMQGIGSGGETGAPSYGNGSGLTDLSSAFGYLSSTVSSVTSTAASLVREQDLTTKVSSGWSYVQNSLGDPALSNNVKSTATTGWSTLTSGANAMWKVTQNVIDAAVNSPRNDEANGLGSSFPRTNPELPSSSKYAGMGVGNTSTDTPVTAHDTDSWLDQQLNESKPKAAMHFAPRSNTPAPISAPTPLTSLSSAPSSTTTTSLGSLTSSSSSPSFGGLDSTASTTLPAPAPIHASSSLPSKPTAMSSNGTAVPLPSAPVPAGSPSTASAPAPTKKKEVDFFGEYGF